MLFLLGSVISVALLPLVGGGPGAVVKAACLEGRRSRVRTPLWHSSFWQQNVSSLLTHRDSIFWGSELGLKPPEFEFRILCLKGSVISFISHPQEVILAQFSLYMHKGGLKPHSFIPTCK